MERSERLDDFYVDFLKYDYEETGNPLFVWQRVQYVLKRGEAIPEWCLPYLQSVADEIMGLGTAPKKKGLFRKLLNLGGQKKFQQAENHNRNFKIACKMYQLIEGAKLKGEHLSQEKAAGLALNSHDWIDVEEDSIISIYGECKKRGYFERLTKDEEESCGITPEDKWPK